MTIPNLGGVIKAEDVYEKGSGSYSASYVAWAKTSQLLRDHASGWVFHLEPNNNEEYVWKAPDGSGYLMCYFMSSQEETEAHANMPLFPFPIMDNRNNPIPYEKITARTFTDSHRRALCACAVFTFGLAHELYTKEEIESHRPTTIIEPVKQETPKTKPVKSELKTVFLTKLKDPDCDKEKIITMAQKRYEEGKLSKDDLTEIKLTA